MWGRLLTRIFALFGMTLTCVACYGVEPADYNPEFAASGRVCDKDGNPIKAIKVNITSGGSYTDDNGVFYVQGTIGSITFTDVDGMENGGEFKSHTQFLQNGYSDIGIVTLYRKGENETNK